IMMPSELMNAWLERLKKLRSRMDKSERANRQELYKEHHRKKLNPKERIRQELKREEAEKLLARQKAEENNERKRFWKYFAESVEKWKKKQEKKLKRSDVAFTASVVTAADGEVVSIDAESRFYRDAQFFTIS
ncbi:23248_t:CDS:2, partial [Racocetra persica]